MKTSNPRGMNGKNPHKGKAYVTRGYRDAKRTSGNMLALEPNLYALYGELREMVERDVEWIKKRMLHCKSQMGKLRRKTAELENIIKKEIEERVPELQKKIEQLREEIADIKNNPERYLEGKVEKAGFYIGLIILVFLTLYLFTFYSSASYSGFFRVFQPGVNLREAMLDPNSFVKALNDGVGELLFILLMPFVFLALGYLIHKFIERKSFVNYLKVLVLLMVTFVFDGFLAYKISEGIYSVSGTLFTEEYTVAKALREVEFWVVIFAGFVSYIVWGIVFDFVMRAHQKLDQIGTMIKLKNEKIQKKEEAIEKSQEKIEKHQEQIDRNNLKYEKNDEEINKKVLPVDDINKIHIQNGLDKSHNQYLKGWTNRLSDLGKSNVEIKQSCRFAYDCLEKYKYNLLNE